MKKRSISLIICLSILLSIISPRTCFATEEDSENISNQIVQREVSVDNYHREQDDVVSDIRAAMESHETNFTVYYVTETELTQSNLVSLMELALAETGIATQGDYIRHAMASYDVDGIYGIVGTEKYYQITYSISYFTTAEQEAELSARVDEVLTEMAFTDKTTDYEKIKTIYDYVCKNVVYDDVNLEDDSYLLKHSAYAALINGTAVCQGYANLLYRMLMEVGITTRYIGCPIRFNGTPVSDDRCGQFG